MTRTSRSFEVAGSLASEVIAAGPRTAAYAVRAAVRPLQSERRYPEIPPDPLTPALVLSVLGEQLLQAALTNLLAPDTPAPETAKLESDRTIEMLDAKGWLDDPRGFHQQPPPLLHPRLEKRRAHGLTYEAMCFESGYRPPEGQQSGENRWNAIHNRTARAYVLNHDDGPRPWLVLLHGYGAGMVWDLSAVGARRFHRDMGFNVVAPVAPYHGERRVGRRSGMGMISVDHVRTLHAFGQAVWDVRRCIAWAKAAGAKSVSVYGVSMGGYLAALLAGVDDRLDRVVAATPATDIAAAILRRTPLDQRSEAEGYGLFGEGLDLVHRPVNPLALSPLLPRERRFIVGATGDQITTVGDAYRLWQHWDKPNVLWFRGTHLTTGLSGQVRRWVDEALGERAVTAHRGTVGTVRPVGRRPSGPRDGGRGSWGSAHG